MKVPNRSALALVVSVSLFAASSADARQGRGNGGGPKTHPVKATSGGGSTHVSGPKSSPAPKVHGGGNGNSAAKAPKPTSTTTASAKAPKGPSSKAPSATTASAKTKSTTTASGTTVAPPTTTTTVTLTPVQQKLQRNTNLAAKLESRLPKGTDLMLASEGFRNLGQFVAAVNVSNNLKIPFADLKMSMVDEGNSLGQSIKTLRPTADSAREVSIAESQASVLLNTDAPTISKTTSPEKKPKTSGGAR
jgi:hypothetical protein